MILPHLSGLLLAPLNGMVEDGGKVSNPILHLFRIVENHCDEEQWEMVLRRTAGFEEL